jgi:hypothetical protein
MRARTVFPARSDRRRRVRSVVPSHEGRALRAKADDKSYPQIPSHPRITTLHGDWIVTHVSREERAAPRNPRASNKSRRNPEVSLPPLRGIPFQNPASEQPARRSLVLIGSRTSLTPKTSMFSIVQHRTCAAKIQCVPQGRKFLRSRTSAAMVCRKLFNSRVDAPQKSRSR